MSEAVAVNTGGEGAVVQGIDGGGVSALPAGMEAGSDMTFSSQLGEHSGLADRFDSVESLAKSYSELEGKFSTRATPPEGGVYEFPSVDGFQFDGDQIGALNEGFLEAGFSQDQFNYALQQHAQIELARNAQESELIASTLNEFKQSQGENYDNILNQANNVIDKINDEGLYNLLKDEKYGHNPTLINAFAKIAELSGESTFPNDTQPAGGMSAEAANTKLSELTSKYRAEPNKAARDAMRVQMDKLHAIIDG